MVCEGMTIEGTLFLSVTSYILYSKYTLTELGASVSYILLNVKI